MFYTCSPDGSERFDNITGFTLEMDLVGRVASVSLETARLVAELPSVFS